jgi:aerobic-type carbon monoxide dehydrogenase small subunit (CoxS/CutS family)
MISLNINGQGYEVDVPPDTPLLWVIREHLRLTGTKFGCGVGECGACTVHLDGQAEKSCLLPVREAQGKAITTIEGLPADHPVKRAWLQEQVIQCGYCQPGQMMQAAALLREGPQPGEEKIRQAMDEVLCRCGTYPRIQKAIQTSLRFLKEEGRKS